MANLEEITRQIAELNTRLNAETSLRLEETARREAAERRLEEAIANPSLLRAAAADSPDVPLPAAVSAPVAHMAKMATPDKFDGQRGAKAEMFIQQVSLYVMTNERSFPSERNKVAFTVSYLAGDAHVWATPYVQKILEENMQGLTFKTFIDAFKGTYYDPHRVSKAENAIRALWQTESVLDYATRFNQLASIISWEDSTLMSNFKGHLKPEITVHLIRDTSTTLEQLVRAAVEIDHLLHPEREGVALFHDSIDDKKAVVQVGGESSGQRVARADDAMDLSSVRFNISNKEFQRRKFANLCYYCGKPNHSASRCTQMKADKEKKMGWKSQLSDTVIGGGSGSSKGGDMDSKNGSAQE